MMGEFGTQSTAIDCALPEEERATAQGEDS